MYTGADVGNCVGAIVGDGVGVVITFGFGSMAIICSALSISYFFLHQYFFFVHKNAQFLERAIQSARRDPTHFR